MVMILEENMPDGWKRKQQWQLRKSPFVTRGVMFRHTDTDLSITVEIAPEQAGNTVDDIGYVIKIGYGFKEKYIRFFDNPISWEETANWVIAVMLQCNQHTPRSEKYNQRLRKLVHPDEPDPQWPDIPQYSHDHCPFCGWYFPVTQQNFEQHIKTIGGDDAHPTWRALNDPKKECNPRVETPFLP